MQTYKVLSIDAWRYDGGWNWNQWFNAGEIELKTLDSNRYVLKQMREQGFLSEYSKGRVYIDDDQYNLVICDRNNNMPIFAIEYGSLN